MNSRQRDRERINQAYGEAQGGVASITSAVGKASRMLWNAQMRLLLSMNAMDPFRKYPGLFVGVGAILLAVVLPIGVVWVIVALFALQNEPLAEEDFIVEIGRASSLMTPWGDLMGQKDAVTVLRRIETSGERGVAPDEIRTALGVEDARLRRVIRDLTDHRVIVLTEGSDPRYLLTDEGRTRLAA